MGRYLTQPPLKRPVKKQQVFTASGTFSPSPGLLAAGGVVEVRCIGGGGGGNNYAGGSSGMDITRIVTVTGPVAVTIGAGGYGSGQGGQTNFGTLLTALGGKPPNINSYQGGLSSGEGSQAGGNAFMRNSVIEKGRGGGSGGGGGNSINGLPNTGGGGSVGNGSPGQGGSGLCVITWEE